MNHFRGLTRFAGSGPQPFAVYRAPIVGGGSMLPFDLGICSYQLPDLAAARTVEEIQAGITSMKARLTELNTEAGVQPLEEEARSEWDAIDNREDGRLPQFEAALKEAQARRDRVEQLAQNPKAREEHRSLSGSPARSRLPDDLYDLSEYRARTTIAGGHGRAHARRGPQAQRADVLPASERGPGQGRCEHRPPARPGRRRSALRQPDPRHQLTRLPVRLRQGHHRPFRPHDAVRAGGCRQRRQRSAHGRRLHGSDDPRSVDHAHQRRCVEPGPPARSRRDDHRARATPGTASARPGSSSTTGPRSTWRSARRPSPSASRRSPSSRSRARSSSASRRWRTSAACWRSWP